jgi:hypothetical protein
MKARSDYVVIEESQNPNLLHVKKSFLESEGIQCEILHENFVRAEGILFSGPIRVQLIVRSDQADDARRLLAAHA